MRSKLQERWSEYYLVTSERPKTRYAYFVSGRGDFPFDMLRHDSCWPATGVDAARLFYLDDRRDVRSVRMLSYSKPTIDRWSSFGWSVGTQDLHSKEERFIDGLIP
jgi:hypothetical protein